MADERRDKRGVVVAFDDHVGLGTIESEGTSYLFHCVEIADGTRTIAVGTPVEFRSVTRFGTLEATDVATLA
jgi:CspA family cold shock protein